MFVRSLLTGGALLAGLIWHGTFPIPFAKAAAVKSGHFVEQTSRLDIPVARYLKRDARSGFDFSESSVDLNGRSLVYRTYRPLKSKKDAPTLVLLHGSGSDGRILLDKWRNIATQEGLFLVAPQSPNLRRWSLHEVDAVTLIGLVDHARERAMLGSGPLLLFGHSAGGVLATRLAQTDPDRFAAIVTHAGFVGENALQQSTPTRSGDRNAQPVPIALLLGDQDKIFSISGARSSGNALARAGHDVDLVIFNDHSHWYYTAAHAINRSAWLFFRKHL